MSPDAYYTPQAAATKLVRNIKNMPQTVVDFCAGDGALLRAILQIAPRVKCIANDLSIDAVAQMSKNNQDWKITNVDFLDDALMEKAGYQQDFFELILLNPPFSSRGKRYKFFLDGIEFYCSKAALFLAKALLYLKGGGVLRAIVPSGLLSAERDAPFVAHLRASYGARIIGRSSGVSFAGKIPDVGYIECRKGFAITVPKPKLIKKEISLNRLVRGSTSVHKIKDYLVERSSIGAIRYLHTTDLKSGVIEPNGRYISREGCCIVEGPGVVFPRVGAPNVGKVCVLRANDSVVLSDCVFALVCKSNVEACQLRNRIIKARDDYTKIYTGTGAKYTTCSKVSRFLRKLGVRNW